ncbi:hypothetical protein RB653_009347 [Dictyostelium firmibasis]|uniref:Uncharacterized protein n=1 Tax=Dictyostelium firmibasis TaxID=79012 RepID=A0AAN7TVC3_9MYCE
MNRGFVTGVRVATKCANKSSNCGFKAASSNNIYNSFKSTCTLNNNNNSNIPSSSQSSPSFASFFSSTSTSATLKGCSPNNSVVPKSLENISSASQFNFSSFFIISDDDDGM